MITVYIPLHIVQKVIEIITAHMGAWFDDDWFSMDDHWDLNLWQDDENCYATLYPVENGMTRTIQGAKDRGVRLYTAKKEG